MERSGKIINKQLSFFTDWLSIQVVYSGGCRIFFSGGLTLNIQIFEGAKMSILAIV